MKLLALGLAFFTELGCFAVYGLVGYQFHFTLVILLPALFIGFWGRYMAPKSSRRLQQPAYSVIKLIIYGLAVTLAAVFVEVKLAAVFAVLAATSELLLKLTGQSRTEPLQNPN